MPTFHDLVNSAPSDTQSLLNVIWESLPQAERSELQSILKGFPSESSLMRLLIGLSLVQFKMAFGRKQKVAIVGPANVGKSTLYNQMIQSKTDKAEVSPLPGTTKTNQSGDAGLFSLIDTPGADSIGVAGERERKLALNAAAEADFLVIVFDSIQGIKKGEKELYDELKSLAKPHLIVLNKIDLVRREEKRVVEKVAANLRLKTDQIIAVSAKEDKNVSQVLTSIAMTEPSIIAALGRALPAYRWQLSWRIIVSAASISAVIALTPLPFVDFAPLIVTQSIMVLGIARIYNYQITLARARELILTFGLGFLGRTVFQELSKLGGIPGWLLSASIASSTTVVMGYAAANWFERGERLSNKTIKVLTKNLTTSLIQALRNLGKRKPNKETLQNRIEQALAQAPVGQDQNGLEISVQ